MEACIDEQPSPLLHRYVEAFWHSEPVTETACDVLPDASVDVCFVLSESKPEIVVFGPSTALSAYQVRANVAHFGVRLKPGAAALLLPECIADFTDATVSMPTFLGTSAEEVLHLQNREARSKYLEAAIVRALAASSRRAAPLVGNAIALIHRTRCAIRIQELAEECGVSRRQLERVFAEQVGVSPKSYTRIYRFRAAMEDIEAHPPVSWADFAALHGYSDQSHFIREYRSFSGRLPTQQ